MGPGAGRGPIVWGASCTQRRSRPRDSWQGGQEPDVSCRLSAAPWTRGCCSVRRGWQGRPLSWDSPPPPGVPPRADAVPAASSGKASASAHPGARTNHQQPSPQHTSPAFPSAFHGAALKVRGAFKRYLRNKGKWKNTRNSTAETQTRTHLGIFPSKRIVFTQSES